MESLYTIRGSFRHSARLVATQLLYQIYQTDEEVEEALRQFEGWYVTEFLSQEAGEKRRRPLSIDLLKGLVRGVVATKSELRTDLKRCLAKGWTVDRLPLVLQIILELGIYELRKGDVPGPVVVNEYIEIAKEFFQGSEPAFVNGLLDRLCQEKNQNRKEPYQDATGNARSGESAELLTSKNKEAFAASIEEEDKGSPKRMSTEV